MSSSNKSSKPNRPLLSAEQTREGIEELSLQLYRRLVQKGYGTFSSKHELQGIITEEYDEVKDAVHTDGGHLADELMDLAVACVFGWVCIKHKTMEW